MANDSGDEGDLFQENLDSDLYSAIDADSVFYSTVVADDGEGGIVMEYRDVEAIKAHIEEVLAPLGSDDVIDGIEELKAATEVGEDGSKPKLRRYVKYNHTFSLNRCLEIYFRFYVLGDKLSLVLCL